MAEPTKEQKKEFLEWCGFTCYYKAGENKSGILAWICPPDNEKTIAFYGFTLDFLFKWAVPKIIEKHGKLKAAEICNNAICTDIESKHKGDFAICLFWAIWEVIKGA